MAVTSQSLLNHSRISSFLVELFQLIIHPNFFYNACKIHWSVIYITRKGQYLRILRTTFFNVYIWVKITQELQIIQTNQEESFVNIH